MKRFLALALPLTASAALVTESYQSGDVNLAIPDFQAVLTPSLLSITGSAITSLSRVEVAFELVGAPGDQGFAGDMRVSLLRTPLGSALSGSDPTALLLDGVASAHNGWNITLADTASADIQTASPTLISEVLTGIYRPLESLDHDFVGLAGNGAWRLNVGDLAAGGTMQLVRWSITLTGDDGAAVPEAGAGTASAAALGLGLWWHWRRGQQKSSSRR